MGTLGLVVMLLLNEAIADAASGKVYFVIEVLYGKGKEIAKTDMSASALLLWVRECSAWIAFFAPLLVSLGFLLNTVNEKKTGCIRMIMQRVGVKKYCLCKVLGGAISSGIIMASAYVIFGMYLALFYNSINDYNCPPEIIEKIIPTNLFHMIAGVLMGSFLYGSFMGMFGIIVVLLFTDKYLIMCVPVLLSFGYNRILVALVNSTSDYNRIEFVYKLFPDRLKQIYTKDFPEEILGITILCYVLIGLMYLFVVKRRKAKDEWI